MPGKSRFTTSSCCGKKFTCSDLGLNYHESDAFYRSQWPCPGVLYMIYRWVALLYFLSWMVVKWVEIVKKSSSPSQAASHLRFFTEWSYDILTVHLVFFAVNATWGYIRKDISLLEGIPIHFKISWLLHNIATPSALVVTFVYWVFLYNSTRGTNALDLHRHAINSIFVIADLFICAVPVRLCHVYQPAIFAAAWGLFSLIWALSGMPPVYPRIDWTGNPGYAVMFVLCLIFVAIPISWAAIFGFYKLRMVIYGAVYKRKFEAKSDEMTQAAESISPLHQDISLT